MVRSEMLRKYVDGWFIQRFRGHRLVSFLYEEDILHDHEVHCKQRGGGLKALYLLWYVSVY